MNNIIDENKINEIRMSVDIVDVIKDYIPLNGKGRNYFGVCPFHDDHSPSMSVSVDKQIYKCFACGAAGNVFKFVQDYENVSFIEAVSILANRAGIELDISIKNIANTNINKSYYEIYDLAQKLYSNNINTKDASLAKDYLSKRDIDANVIKEFGIGLSLKNNSILSNLLKNKGYSENDLLDSGLIVKKDFEYKDIYYDRIMFPLFDLKGSVIGFSGRIYGDAKDSSKYINTKQTEVFKKGELLYNYHKAKDYAREKNQIIIVEGFMDVIRAYTIGIYNVVATMGTAVTKKQAQLIKKLGKEVILCFDGDDAGAKATLACSNELLNIDVTPKVIRLEENLDPDEYIKKYGKDKFLSKLEYPINIMDFKLSYLKKDKDLTSNVDKAKYINEIIAEVNKIDDDILRELTIDKLSSEMKIDKEFIKGKLENKKIVIPTKKIQKKNLSLIEKAEQELLFYLLSDNEIYEKTTKKIGYLPDSKYRELYREITYFYDKNGYINIADIMTFLSNNENMLKLLNEIINLNLKEEVSMDGIDDYIKTIGKFNINTQCEELTNKMRSESDILKKAQYAQKIVDLKKMLNDM